MFDTLGEELYNSEIWKCISRISHLNSLLHGWFKDRAFNGGFTIATSGNILALVGLLKRHFGANIVESCAHHRCPKYWKVSKLLIEEIQRHPYFQSYTSLQCKEVILIQSKGILVVHLQTDITRTFSTCLRWLVLLLVGTEFPAKDDDQSQPPVLHLVRGERLIVLHDSLQKEIITRPPGSFVWNKSV